MAVFTAVQNGDMDTAATFGGDTTPATGDEIALGGYTVSCSSDKRALATGITISGTGKLLILSGGAFKTATSIPETCAVQFGEPEGVGAGPLPAYGALDANASGEILLNGLISILGSCAVYTAERAGKHWARVTGKTSTTVSVLDDASTDWRAGDTLTPYGKAYAYEYAVVSWTPAAMELTHAAATAGYNDEGTVFVRASCAALIKSDTTSPFAVLDGGISGYGSLYISATQNTILSRINGKIDFSGRLVVNYRKNSYAYSSAAFGACIGSVGSLFCCGGIVHDADCSQLEVSGGAVLSTVPYTSAQSFFATMRNVKILTEILCPDYAVPFGLTLIDCDLPSPLLSSALSPGQFVKVANAAMTTETLHTAGGIAIKVQHAALPGTNDLPDAYLLAPVTSRAYYDYWLTVKRGQTARIRFHAWLSTDGATCGYEIHEETSVAEVATPLMAYTVPVETEILEWHRPTPEIYYNATGRDQLLRIRAWAEGDNCYVRCSPEQGGGEL